MRSLVRFVVLAALVLGPLGVVSARQDTGRSPRNASYTLHATLDPERRTITGQGTLVWRNISIEPTSELRFHLYWNAWRDGNSTWMREQALGRNTSLAQRPAAHRGSIEITELVLRGATSSDLAPAATHVSPDDGNADDRTVLRVPLPRPIAPGDVITVDFRWRATVPVPYARTGAQNSYFLIAHWFPKVGVLEDTGWNAHQFHAATEFFADFGTYDVSLTVPSGWIVGATGRAVEQRAGGAGLTTHRFVEHDVNDFAWTTSPDFIGISRTFSEAGLPPVEMRLLLQPEHRGQEDRHFSAASAALKFYGTWFGPYPHRQLTIVDPVTVTPATTPWSGTGGMEYPTFITAGSRWLSPWSAQEPEHVIVHEVGHQFFHSTVATNEVEHAWMDEGINTYVTAQVMAEAYPHRFVEVDRYFGGIVVWPYADARWSREVHGNRLLAYRASPNRDALATPAWQYWPGTASATSYAKTAVWLTTLERLVGPETMRRVIATYFQRHSFRHPTPDEFMAIASEVSGRDLSWFFDTVYRSSATFDYAVEAVTHRTVAHGEPEATVVIRRLADGIFPVDVRVDFADGTHAIERWDGRDRWKVFSYGRRVATVRVDPDRILQLDQNETNNSWTSRPRARDAAGKWATHWLLWLEHTLLTYAFFI